MAIVRIETGQSLASVVRGLPTDEASLQRIREANKNSAHPISDFRKMVPGEYDIPDDLMERAAHRQAKRDAPAPTLVPSTSTGPSMSAPIAPRSAPLRTTTALRLEPSVTVPSVHGPLTIDLRTDPDVESAIAAHILREAQKQGHFRHVVFTTGNRDKNPPEYDFGDKRKGHGGVDDSGAAIYSDEVDAFWTFVETFVAEHFKSNDPRLVTPEYVDADSPAFKNADGTVNEELLAQAKQEYALLKTEYLGLLRQQVDERLLSHDALPMAPL